MFNNHDNKLVNALPSRQKVVTLSDEHLRMLQQDSGICPEAIQQRGYRTVTTKAELIRLGFAANQRLVPTLLIPLWGTSGEEVV